MSKKPAPIDTAAIESATRFDASIFLGTGRYHTASFDNLVDAREAARKFAEVAKNGRKGMVYAVPAEGRSIFVPASYQPPTKPEGLNDAIVRPTVEPTTPAKVPKAGKPAAKRAEILAAALRGELPAAPDFSAETHKRFRPKLARLVEMAEKGDVEGLEAEAINPVSSSPKAMDKYRNLAVIALKAIRMNAVNP